VSHENFLFAPSHHPNMSTLADTFLQDLGEEGESLMNVDEDKELSLLPEFEPLNSNNISNNNTSHSQNSINLNSVPSMLKYDNVKDIATLLDSEKLHLLMQKLEEYIKKDPIIATIGPVETDPEYQLIVECNSILVEIATEIGKIHKFIQDHYQKRFPELESLVLNPLDYARVVKKIGNQSNLTAVDLSGILPAATIMVVTVTASHTTGVVLSDKEINTVLQACDEALALDEMKKSILAYVESRMSFIAPNLSAIVGSSIAAQLLGIAGGLSALSRLPSCNVQVLGANKKALSGFSSSNNPHTRHTGFIHDCDIINNTPPSLRLRACRLVSLKCTLAARVDSFHDSKSGEVGKKLRSEIEKKIEKWQEPPPAKLPKPLPAPDDKPRKKRGGRRMRKMKEKYSITELHKHANRMVFGLAEDTFRETGKGFGMLSHSGKVRLSLSQVSSNPLTKEYRAKKQKQKHYGSTTSGVSSSLAFTPAQGLELENPQAATARNQESKRYFGSTSFIKVSKESQPKVDQST